MERHVAQLMNDDILKEAARLFSCDEHPFKLLGDFENYVYEVSQDGEPAILRLTHSSHRSTGMVEAELHWLNYLANQNVSVARPRLSNDGKFVEVIPAGDSTFNVSLFEKAPGQLVKKGTDAWGSSLFQVWGETIGKIHSATESYVKPNHLPRRLTWDEDDLLDIEALLPQGQNKVVEKTRKHVRYLQSLPKNSKNYGLIHSDIHPGNFFVHEGLLTVFDFDDSMYHWFVSDIAIALYYSLFWINEDDRNAFAKTFMTSFLAGYRKEYALDQEWIARIPDFLILRDILLYAVFYKKLDMTTIDEKQKALLASLKHRIENEESVVDIDFSQL